MFVYKRDDEVNWTSYDQVLKSLTCSITVLLLSSSGLLHQEHKHFSHHNAFAGRSTDWNYMTSQALGAVGHTLSNQPKGIGAPRLGPRS